MRHRLRPALRYRLRHPRLTGGGGEAEPSPFLIDNLDVAPDAAWSPRKLKTGVTSVVRAVRFGDFVEDDFAADELLDGTLATWVAENGSFEDRATVKTWYDQSGSGFNLTQFGTGPSLMESGAAILTPGGKQSMRWQSRRMRFSPGDAFHLHQDSTLSVVLKTNAVPFADEHTILSRTQGISNDPAEYRLYLNQEEQLVLDRPFVEAGVTGAANSIGTSAYKHVICRVEGTSVTYRINGADALGDTLANGSTSTEPVEIGVYLTSSGVDRQFDGYIAEIIVWLSALGSADMELLEQNVNDYYELY